MTLYHIYGTIKADININELVEAKSKKIALKYAYMIIEAKHGITDENTVDEEIYCEVP